MTNLILCGGSGTRLWPISRTLMPKQFVKLFDDESLFQRTVRVNSEFCSQQIIISNAEQYFLAKSQLVEQSRKDVSFLLEPMGRNTAPAIALACLELKPETIVLVTPSDHIIRDTEAYGKVVSRAKELAEEGNLVTFGIRPNQPETGYGYIEAKGENVMRFVEKPNRETAEKYLASGNFFWNSGIFCFKAGVFLKELEIYAPEIFSFCREAFNKAQREENVIRIQSEDMKKIPANSIDYAVMEKSERVKMVPSNIGWSDLGSFESLYQEMPHDENGNAFNANHISINSHNNLVLGDSRKIATIDLEDMIIIDTPDALLAAPRKSSQKVKEAVDELKRQGSELPHVPQTVTRPWGSYSVLEKKENYKVKTITVMPAERLSLQKHLHRSEHWVVISGEATVTVDEKTFIVPPNESAFIPQGSFHRLENKSNIPLIIVEVQVGDYLGEDDIIRLDDDYKRV